MKKITAPRWELTIIMVVLLMASTTMAIDRTVIIPLGGAIGDAEITDVLKDKTFSSKEGKGLIGARPLSPVPRSGDETCSDSSGTNIDCAGTGQDGEIQSGVALPTPRFTDNGNGTVTDNLTSLVWLQNADCFGLRTWDQALVDSNNLANGSCGLSDGSSLGEWRLPNAKELQSLIDLGHYNPCIVNAAGTAGWTEGDPFSNVRTNYWSSTNNASNAAAVWYLEFQTGTANVILKTATFSAWPVRDPQ